MAEQSKTAKRRASKGGRGKKTTRKPPTRKPATAPKSHPLIRERLIQPWRSQVIPLFDAGDQFRDRRAHAMYATALARAAFDLAGWKSRPIRPEFALDWAPGERDVAEAFDAIIDALAMAGDPDRIDQAARDRMESAIDLVERSASKAPQLLGAFLEQDAAGRWTALRRVERSSIEIIEAEHASGDAERFCVVVRVAAMAATSVHQRCNRLRQPGGASGFAFVADLLGDLHALDALDGMTHDLLCAAGDSAPTSTSPFDRLCRGGRSAGATALHRAFQRATRSAESLDPWFTLSWPLSLATYNRRVLGAIAYRPAEDMPRELRETRPQTGWKFGPDETAWRAFMRLPFAASSYPAALDQLPDPWSDVERICRQTEEVLEGLREDSEEVGPPLSKPPHSALMKPASWLAEYGLVDVSLPKKACKTGRVYYSGASSARRYACCDAAAAMPSSDWTRMREQLVIDLDGVSSKDEVLAQADQRYDALRSSD
ncbi:MAG: hypothetical protein VYC34_05860 [Planctomycetota bacterium]|nr:hypothetical protein [Planctomycetota bacterium]